MVYSAVLTACGMDSHWFGPQTSTNTCRHICRYMDQKDLAVMLIPIQVSRCHTRGEFEEWCTGKKACK